MKVQTCLIHVLPNQCRLRLETALARDRRQPQTCPTRPPPLADTQRAVEEFAEKWGTAYPAMIRLWRNAWTEFVPFLDYDIEIRKVLCSTNATSVAERPVPSGGPGQGALPERAGHVENPVSDHEIVGPQQQSARPDGACAEKPALNTPHPSPSLTACPRPAPTTRNRHLHR